MVLTLILIAASLLVIRFIVFLLANGLGWKRLRVCECRRFATDCATPDDVCTVCGRDLPPESVAARPHFRLGRTQWEIRFTNQTAEIAELERMWRRREAKKPSTPSSNLRKSS